MIYLACATGIVCDYPHETISTNSRDAGATRVLGGAGYWLHAPSPPTPLTATETASRGSRDLGGLCEDTTSQSSQWWCQPWELSPAEASTAVAARLPPSAPLLRDFAVRRELTHGIEITCGLRPRLQLQSPAPALRRVAVAARRRQPHEPRPHLHSAYPIDTFSASVQFILCHGRAARPALRHAGDTAIAIAFHT